jgi:flagellar basal body-associated protein FliL
MPSSEGQSGQSRGSNWRGILATLLVQVLVLAAVSVAAIYYVNWSSQAALAEFAGAVKPSVSDHWRRFSSPIQPVKGRMSCARRA